MRHFEQKFDNIGSLQRDIELVNNDIAQCRQTLWCYVETDGVRDNQKVINEKTLKDLHRLTKIKLDFIKMYTALENMGRTIGGGNKGPTSTGGGGRSGVLKMPHGKSKSVHSQAANASLGPPQDPMLAGLEGGRGRKRAHNNISLLPYSDPGFT